MGSGHQISEKTSLRLGRPDIMRTEYNVQDAPIVAGAYAGRSAPADNKMRTLEEYQQMGYLLHAWDGITPTVITDVNGLIVAYLAGRPTNRAEWEKIMKGCKTAMETANRELTLGNGNRRGPYRSITAGISVGPGSTRPGTLAQKPYNEEPLQRLVNDINIQRAAHFASSCMAMLAPKMYQEYFDGLDQVLENDPSLRPLFPNSVFAATSWNFGPKACTVPHVDSLNRAVGWCSIFALGDFDPLHGGQIVLDPLRLIIVFPAGSTILIPSAIFRHGNTPIREGETRMVMTQFSSGGIYRMVEQGFKTLKELRRDKQDDAQKFDSPTYKKERESQQLNLFSTVENLHADRVKCGVVRLLKGAQK
ncbi:hypothetical protein EIP86_000265 [Pleurotus ostreatoroseus]|nr:hypothetical protein EIP86_000265 [Pleurotus ostreatoroseus]